MSARRKQFVIDYDICGTLHLSSPNHIAVALRAEELIRRAMADLQEISVYCEETIDTPIDYMERYPMLQSANSESRKASDQVERSANA